MNANHMSDARGLEPKASQVGSGWDAIGTISRRASGSGAPATRIAPSGQRAIDQTAPSASLQPCVRERAPELRPARRSKDERADGCKASGKSQAACAQRVLGEARPVALDAVDPVRPAARSDPSRSHRRRLRSRVPRTGRVRSSPSLTRIVCRKDLARRPGREILERRFENAAERLLVENAGEAHDGDQRREEGEHELECERPRVAERIGPAEPHERVTG